MRFLLAFDKFKDALPAQEACAVAARALGSTHLIEQCPLTDGGDGFCEVLTRAVGGELVSCEVTGPLGEKRAAHFGLIAVEKLPSLVRRKLELQPDERSRVALIEMAQASGLALVPPAQRNPWNTTSHGVGEMLCAAAEAGVDAIVLGVGGSATHDVGLGALTELGLECLTADGKTIASPVPHTWAALAGVRGTLRQLPPIFVACDVQNPLMGTFGAANVYAPQKGLLPEDFTRLEYMTGRVAAMLCAHAKKHPLLCETPGAGAAGGIAFGLHCALDAKLLRGSELVAAWLDLETKIAGADVVVTGEGCFDDTSLQGKATGALVQRALTLGKRVHVFAGAVAVKETPADLQLHAITAPGTDRDTALRDAGANLTAAVQAVFG